MSDETDKPAAEINYSARIYSDRSVPGRAKSDQEAKTYLQAQAEQRAKDAPPPEAA